MSEELIPIFKQYQEGSEDAFVKLYHLTLPNIWGFIRKRVHKQKQDDCFQQFWLHLHTKKHLYQGQPVLAWMFVILRNLIIDEYRSQKNVKETSYEPYMDRGVEESTIIQDIISELPPQEKELVERVYLQGFNYEDLEKEWGLSQTSLRKRLSRSITQLSKKIGGAK